MALPIKINSDRYLLARGNRYVYRRRVPKEVADLDDRAPIIQIPLKTDDIALARGKRDLLEEADNVYWSELILTNDNEKARLRYKAAVKRAEAFGFAYKTSFDIAKLPIEDIAERIQTAIGQQKSTKVIDSVLGVETFPSVSISTAEEVYFNEIMPNVLSRKSDGQRHHWIKERTLSINYLKEQIGDKNVNSVDREDALTFYRYLNKFVTSNERSSSWGKRQLGNIRKFFDDYFTYVGIQNPVNPFSGLSFKDFSVSRPPFSLEWIKNTILRPGALDGLNSEARHILLILIDTGARMGEICNLQPEDIHLEKYPFIEIKPRIDPNNPREIKTRSSIRTIPLIGLAYAAIQRSPEGFPRYRDKETHLSNLLNKFFRQNNLFETNKHVIYSFRHSFEDRMKEAAIQVIKDKNNKKLQNGPVCGEINSFEINALPLGGDILDPVPHANGTVNVGVIADGKKISQITQTNELCRLPSGFLARKWEIDVSGDVAISTITMAKTIDELKASS